VKKAIVNSLPKAGTNLVAKCLTLFGYEEKAHLGAGMLQTDRRGWLRRFAWIPLGHGYMVGIDSPVVVGRRIVKRILNELADGEFITAHVGYTADILIDSIENGLEPIVVIRDPRAVLNSFVHYVAAEKRHAFHRVFSELPQEERFLKALDGVSNGRNRLQPFRQRLLALDPWLSEKGVLRLRFEDLVGSHGGASDEAQRETLEALGTRLRVAQADVDDVAKRLFGPGRATFRLGRVDAWKSEMPTRIRQLVESQCGDIIAAWGYA
jgi:hypothetical protein